MSLVVEKARDEAEAANLQSVAWASRYVGAILASLASGAAIEALGAQGCFAATALLPLLLCAAALGIDDWKVYGFARCDSKPDGQCAECKIRYEEVFKSKSKKTLSLIFGRMEQSSSRPPMYSMPLRA